MVRCYKAHQVSCTYYLNLEIGDNVYMHTNCYQENNLTFKFYII